MTSRKSTKKCLYCNNKDHTILKCKKDSMMFLTLSGRELKDKTKLSKFSKKQLLRLTVEVCRHYTTAPLGTKHFIEHLSPHCNKDKVVDFVHSITNNLLETEKETKECPICYEKLGKTKCRTSCGHEFCTGCFTKIFTTSRHSPSCPMCRASLVHTTTTSQERQHSTGNNIQIGGITPTYRQSG